MSTNSFNHLIDECTCHGKTYSKCHQKQCYHAFAHDKRRSDGLHGHCNTCRNVSSTKYRRVHPERVYISKHNSRARKEHAVATLTPQQWLDLKAFYDYRCLCCGKQEPEITLTLDHIIPISKGGSTDLANAQPLCRACNKKKGPKTIDFRTVRAERNGEP